MVWVSNTVRFLGFSNGGVIQRNPIVKRYNSMGRVKENRGSEKRLKPCKLSKVFCVPTLIPLVYDKDDAIVIEPSISTTLWENKSDLVALFVPPHFSVKCGFSTSARQVFAKMSKQNAAFWNLLINDLVQVDDGKGASLSSFFTTSDVMVTHDSSY